MLMTRKAGPAPTVCITFDKISAENSPPLPRKDDVSPPPPPPPSLPPPPPPSPLALGPLKASSIFSVSMPPPKHLPPSPPWLASAAEGFVRPSPFPCVPLLALLLLLEAIPKPTAAWLAAWVVAAAAYAAA